MRILLTVALAVAVAPAGAGPARWGESQARNSSHDGWSHRSRQSNRLCRQGRGRHPRPAAIRFAVLEVLQGPVIEELRIRGRLSPTDDYNAGPPPYTFVRREGRRGDCFASSYRDGGQFLLFLKRDDAGYTRIGRLLRRSTNSCAPTVTHGSSGYGRRLRSTRPLRPERTDGGAISFATWVPSRRSSSPACPAPSTSPGPSRARRASPTAPSCWRRSPTARRRLTGVARQRRHAPHARGADALGIDIARRARRAARVDGGRGRLRAATGPLFVGNSGTTVRFLAALAALVPGEVTLVGDDAMAQAPDPRCWSTALRPARRRVRLRDRMPAADDPRWPAARRRASACAAISRASTSPALLMAAALRRRRSDVEIEGALVSRPYVDITRRMIARLRRRGRPRRRQGSPSRAGQRYHGRALRDRAGRVVRQLSVRAAAALGGAVSGAGLGRDALQGDYAFAAFLEQAGAGVTRSDDVDAGRAAGTLRGVDVDMHAHLATP